MGADSEGQELVSVIVVNHNRAELLEECLKSLLLQSYQNFEAIVVDNGSEDSSGAVINRLQDSRIRWVPLNENLGFAAGCNAGFVQARGSLFALLNNDATADREWLEALVQGIQAKSNLGMCASKVLFHDSSVIDKVGHVMFWDGQNRGKGTGETDRGQYGQSEPTFFPDGCAALYRRELIDQVGGFDEDFFAYADDADLGIRARLKGWSCRFISDAVVYHRHSSTSGRFSPQKVYWIERNRIWLVLKNFPLALLLMSPLFTLYRWGWNLLALVVRAGPAGSYRKEGSFLTLVSTIARAHRDGLLGLAKMLEKRRRIRSERDISDWQFFKLLWRFRISAREMAWKEKPFK